MCSADCRPLRRCRGDDRHREEADKCEPRGRVIYLLRYLGWHAAELYAEALEPVFLDYLHLGFTNATAFSPTDVLPLTHRAK